jgi:hypothetical protein
MQLSTENAFELRCPIVGGGRLVALQKEKGLNRRFNSGLLSKITPPMPFRRITRSLSVTDG